MVHGNNNQVSGEPPATTGAIRRRTYFAQVPEDLVYAGRSHTSVNGVTTGAPDLAPVSDSAFRLYSVLDRHADKSGQSYPSVERLAALLGKSPSRIRALSAELCESGWIEKVPRHGEDGRQTSNLVWLNDRPTPPPENRRLPPPENERGTLLKTGAKPESLDPESLGTNSPTPLEEGKNGNGRLFERSGSPTAAELRRANSNPGITDAFERWWNDYPTGKRGSKAKAHDAYRRAIGRGITATMFTDHLANYADARSRYRDHFHEWPPLLHGSTFVNSRHPDWDHEWTDEEIADAWPAPPGRTWAKPEPRETPTEVRARILGSV